MVLRAPVFLAGQAVSMLGDGLAVLAIPLLVLQVSHSPLAAVLASLPGSAGYLAAGLPAGVVADRLSPWHVLIAGDILRAGIFAALFAVTGSASVSAVADPLPGVRGRGRHCLYRHGAGHRCPRRVQRTAADRGELLAGVRQPERSDNWPRRAPACSPQPGCCMCAF